MAPWHRREPLGVSGPSPSLRGRKLGKFVVSLEPPNRVVVRLAMLRLSCAFTDTSSNRTGTVVSDCRAAAGSFVACSRCKPSVLLLRCTGCYAKFQEKVGRRIAELEAAAAGEKAFRPAAIVGLLGIDWVRLGKNPADIKGAGAEPHLVEIDGLPHWRHACTCC